MRKKSTSTTESVNIQDWIILSIFFGLLHTEGIKLTDKYALDHEV